MNDAQVIKEFRDLHKRCDDLSTANNVLPDAASELLLRVRAYENRINRSWILTRWFAQVKIVREMKRNDAMEGLINKTQADRDARALKQQQEAKIAEVRRKSADAKVKKREKKFKKNAKKQGATDES